MQKRLFTDIVNGRQYRAGTHVESTLNQSGFSTMALNQRLFNVDSCFCAQWVVLLTFIGNATSDDRSRG